MGVIERSVADSYSEDSGRGIARLDPKTLTKLGIEPGEQVRISGKTDAFVTAWRADRADWEQGEIRIYQYTRYNAGVERGDTVTLSEVSFDSLDRAFLIPYRDANVEFGENATQMIKEQLLSRPVRIGSVVPLQLSGDRRPVLLVVTGPAERGPGLITGSTTVQLAEGYKTNSQ